MLFVTVTQVVVIDPFVGAPTDEAASLAKVVTLVKPEATPDQANVVPFFVCAVVLTQ